MNSNILKKPKIVINAKGKKSLYLPFKNVEDTRMSAIYLSAMGIKAISLGNNVIEVYGPNNIFKITKENDVFFKLGYKKDEEILKYIIENSYGKIVDVEKILTKTGEGVMLSNEFIETSERQIQSKAKVYVVFSNKDLKNHKRSLNKHNKERELKFKLPAGYVGLHLFDKNLTSQVGRYIEINQSLVCDKLKNDIEEQIEALKNNNIKFDKIKLEFLIKTHGSSNPNLLGLHNTFNPSDPTFGKYIFTQQVSMVINYLSYHFHEKYGEAMELEIRSDACQSASNDFSHEIDEGAKIVLNKNKMYLTLSDLKSPENKDIYNKKGVAVYETCKLKGSNLDIMINQLENPMAFNKFKGFNVNTYITEDVSDDVSIRKIDHDNNCGVVNIYTREVPKGKIPNLKPVVSHAK